MESFRLANLFCFFALLSPSLSDLPSSCLSDIIGLSAGRCCTPHTFILVEFTLGFGCDVPQFLDGGVRFEMERASQQWEPIRFYSPTFAETEPSLVHFQKDDPGTVLAQAFNDNSTFPFHFVNISEGPVKIKEYLCGEEYANDTVRFRWMQRYVPPSIENVSTWWLDDIKISRWDGARLSAIIESNFSDYNLSSYENYNVRAGTIESPPCSFTDLALYFRTASTLSVPRRSLVISHFSLSCIGGNCQSPIPLMRDSECTVTTCGADAVKCSVGSFQECSTCPSGFTTIKEISPNPVACLDEDECSLMAHNCSGVAECINTLGSFYCSCPPGYTLSSEGNTCLATEFCLSETVIVEGIEYLWPKTPAGTNASIVCQNNPRFSVMRNCNASGTWQRFDLAGCGMLTSQLRETLSYLEGNSMLSQENITMTIQSLALFVKDSVNSPVDHTRENLNETATILTIVANHVQNQTTVDSMIAEAATGLVDSLLQWDQAAIEAQTSSMLVRSFEVITSVIAQHLPSLNFSFPFITLNTQLINLKDLQENGSSLVIEDEKYVNTDDIQTSSPVTPYYAGIPMSISLPPSLFKQINDTDTNSTGLVFIVYRKSTLFPVGRNTSSSNMANTITQVGTNIIATNVGRDIVFENLQDPVTIMLQLRYKKNVSDNIRCVFWDFDLEDWTTRGCVTIVGQNGTIMCTCNHLTNFAALIDICSRQDGCEPVNPIVDTLLSFISYIGIVVSITGLTLTIITILAFKKLRGKDFAEHHIQFVIALLLMLITSLILISLTASETASILYGGCMTVSVLVHYFALVAVMWMGAEALLMFRKVVFVFAHITTKYIITVSLVCWLLPVVPVLVSMVTDLSTGDDPTDDIIIRRAAQGKSLCFLSHSGAFWGAFLAPILLIVVFNTVLFIWIVIVMVQHISRRKTFQTNKMGHRKVIETIIRLTCVMFLFGFAWLFAILTISVPGLRDTFQILFTIFNSFQGAFIFLFFCVLNEEARDSWKSVIVAIHKKILQFQLSNPSHLHDMDSAQSTKLSSDSQQYSLSLSTSGQSSSKL